MLHHGMRYPVAFAGGLRLGPELCLNPGFETAGTGGADVFANWIEYHGDQVVRTTTAGEFRSGLAAAKVQCIDSSDSNVSQIFAVSPGQRYRLAFWARGDGTYSGRRVLRDLTNSAWIPPCVGYDSVGITGTTFQMYTEDFTIPAGCVSLRIYLYSPYFALGTVIAYFDDVSLRQIL